MSGKIKAKNSSWHFGKNVPKKFDVHIKKSVPHYEGMHDLIANLSDFFLKKIRYVMILVHQLGLL